MKIPFGRYQGTEVKELPIEYCEWLLNHADNLYGELEKEVAERLGIEVDRLNDLRQQVAFYKKELERWQIEYAELALKYANLQQQLTYTDKGTQLFP